LTTVIALEYSKGDDARAIAMGLILLALALGISGAVHASGLWRVGERG
jgi:ABC-type tungstate transport system substrate-binding protein